MTRGAAGKDRGLEAVARVREVRERDSRIGLLQAMASVEQRQAELTRLEEALAEADGTGALGMGDYVARRQLLTAAAREVREAEARLRASRTVAAEAQGRWQSDKARLKAIEHLLEERARKRAEAFAQVEAKEADDIVSRLHGRHEGRTNPQEPTE